MFGIAKARVAAALLVGAAALSLIATASAAPKHASIGKTRHSVAGVDVGYTGFGALGGWSYPSS